MLTTRPPKPLNWDRAQQQRVPICKLLPGVSHKLPVERLEIIELWSTIKKKKERIISNPLAPELFFFLIFAHPVFKL
jgi:hypothetical protein